MLASSFGHKQHALLRFGEHDFGRRHPGFALRDESEIELDAGFGAAAHFTGGAGQSSGAHILDAHDGSGAHGFKAGFEQELFHERIAHLHVGTLLHGIFGKFRRCHGGAVDAVASGFRAHVNYGIADTGRASEENFVMAENAQGEDVHQRVAVIARLEHAFAADGGNAKAVTVVRNAADHAFHDALVPFAGRGIVERSEAQRIHHGDGTRAHGENIAQDAADAGGGALERLDKARVIVRFDLEGDGVVFARTDQHAVALGGELLQVEARALVRAVLAPHDGEDADFCFVGLTLENGADLVEFGGC